MKRWGRMVLWTALAGVALAPARSREARASVDDWLGGGGDMPAYFDDATARERPRTLRINGVELTVAAGATHDPPGAVRRFYGDRFGDARHGYDLLARALRENGAPAEGRELNLLRLGDDERGMLAGVDFGGAPTADEVAARMGRVAATGDVGALGKLQMVMFERGSDGGTRYLDMWLKDGLSLDALVPADGDVDGDDLADVPRPAEARRTFAIAEVGRGEKLRAYRVRAASLVAVRDFYEGAMPGNGWRRDEAFARFAAARGRNAMRFERRGRELYLDFSREGDDVDVVAMELGR
jgi:hypothetical protein